MKVGIVGSRKISKIDLEQYLTFDIEEIVSGGAKEADLCAKKYALEHSIKLTEYLPEYKIFKRNAPLIRNKKIVEYADMIFAFWDGTSKGTKFTIDYAHKIEKPIRVIVCQTT